MDQPTVKDEDPVTVESYRPSQYQEQVWPVISEDHEPTDFIPANFEKVAQKEYVVDPMFADFSQIAKSGQAIELSREAGEFELEQIPPGTEPIYEVETTSESEIAADCQTETEDEDTGPVLTEGATSHDDMAVEHIRVSNDESSGDEIHVEEVVTEELSVDNPPPVNESEHTSDEPALTMTEGAAEGGEVAEASYTNAALAEACDQAYLRGRGEAREEVLEVQRQLEERYMLLWEDMQVQLEESARTHERNAVDLAFQVAKRLIGSLAEGSQEYLGYIIKEAMKHAGGASISEVRVSPQDYEALKLGEYGNRQKVISGEHVSFVSDESIRAGCVLVTSAGEVDYNLDRAWERIRAKALQEPGA
jgi:flagellar biosynthesis/type III secretory pathway protein FliH